MDHYIDSLQQLSLTFTFLGVAVAELTVDVLRWHPAAAEH